MSAIDKRQQDYQERRADLHWRLDQEFLRGTIGAPTYLRSLTFHGYSVEDASVELRKLEAIIKERPDEEATRIARSKKYLVDRQSKNAV